MSEISKELFKSENFSITEFINKHVQNESQLEGLDVLTFKLSIIKKNYESDLEISSQKIMKSYLLFENDLASVNQNLELLSKKYRGIKENLGNLHNCDLNQLGNVVKIIKSNSNLRKVVENKENI